MTPTSATSSATDVPTLSALGISPEDVRTVVMQCYQSYISVGPLHPKGFSGTSGWADGTQTLRALMIPKGWKPQDPNGQPRIVSPGRKHAITVSSGDENTGNPFIAAQTRNTKGSQTTRSVAYNSGQQDLFGHQPICDESVALGSTDEQILWFLLYHVDMAANQVRYELSCPVSIEGSGRIRKWGTRVYFEPISVNSIVDIAPESEPEDPIDIPIKSKHELIQR